MDGPAPVRSYLEHGTYIVDGTSKHFAHVVKKIGNFREKDLVCDFSRVNRIPLTVQKTEIASYVRTYT